MGFWRWLMRLTHRVRAEGALAGSYRPARRPLLEPLEDRVQPSASSVQLGGKLYEDLLNRAADPDGLASVSAALDAAEPRAAEAVLADDFEGAMSALASLRAPIDAFFDKVTVNDADREKRTARRGLLMRVRNAVHEVADFSRVEG